MIAVVCAREKSPRVHSVRHAKMKRRGDRSRGLSCELRRKKSQLFGVSIDLKALVEISLSDADECVAGGLKTRGPT